MFSGSNSGHRGTRSLSPFRVSTFAWEEKEQQQSTRPFSSNSKSSSTLLSSLKGRKKWRMKDFLLFPSALEGRATDKGPFNICCVFLREEERGGEKGEGEEERSGRAGEGAAAAIATAVDVLVL
uniref:Uncharacterized protein n=1 Tax=Nelumbo nucifera TaxID=4432 RepID=A0A822XKC7_NELNU|nr:TPA_asm: hypothetical protein HUJ06_023487 [Nelumbo nucifera]